MVPSVCATINAGPCIGQYSSLPEHLIYPEIPINTGEWLDTESNRGHEDFQSSALPTELSSLYLGTFMAPARAERNRGLIAFGKRFSSLRHEKGVIKSGIGADVSPVR